MPLFEQTPFEVFQGDAEATLRTISETVDCVITSPPYFKQRQYGKDEAEIGKETTVEEFISKLVDIFLAVPLAPWGSTWVNIGDKRGKDGELLCVPERFVIAMQAAGYILIDKVVWAKEVIGIEGTSLGGHCMIEPAPGRLNGNGYEPFYRFVKRKDANKTFTDMCAVNIPREHVEGTRYKPDAMTCVAVIEGRRLPNVWSIPPSSRGKGHFASYPTALVERPIAMTCPEWVTTKGPRERIVKTVEYDEKKPNVPRIFSQYSLVKNKTLTQAELTQNAGRQDAGRTYTPKHAVHVGWTLEDEPTRPGIVLDMFCGTGTTGEAALRLGRRFIGIDLYEEFANQAWERCKAVWEYLPLADSVPLLSVLQQ